MGLFQKSVISRYLKNQNKETIASIWKQYSTHFLNSKVQEEIKGLKEEQYQGEFLEDLFVKILGYTKPASAGETKFNLTSEYKNVKDSKKSDGAIIIDNKVKAVIELKGTNTTDLGKIEEQAFGYKNNQHDCIYVITSNFEKLRFYIDNAIEHIEFNLFRLTEEEFKLLYLCVGFENLSQNIAKVMKDESLSEEDVITKKLYKDYSLFKKELHQNLVELNPEVDPLVLYKKSQKLLDRFLFLFFGEDRNLLPPNSVRLILTQWNQLRDLDEYAPLYGRFKKYFGYLNIGYKGKQHEVFAYNGGLFKSDEVLDAIVIDDDLLYQHTLKLSEYDFASEVDVNILGHIFENSLNELDEIKAELEGLEIDKTKTKRKREGVFYTPKYTTKYMIDNTVGKLCDEKKLEFKIVEEDYFTDKKRQKNTIKTLAAKLESYRTWLLQLTICDPACGSGAFLNQALEFLIAEHRYIDELQAKLFGDALVLSDIENSILENNLFGVDINEESVEIAKLSLWLRTAQPNRKLNDLSNNIKCGNSLIDDPKVAGEKAFNWQKEFPQVFGATKDVEIEIVEALPYEPDYLALLQTDAKQAAELANQAIAMSKEAIALSEKAAALSQKVYEYAQQLQTVSEPTPHYGINKGGFDVVIGNPPYVLCQPSSTSKNTLEFYKQFEVASYKIDLFHLFFEKAIGLLKPNGMLAFITPNTYLTNKYIQKLRYFILKNTSIQCVVIYEDNVFVDAGVDVATIILKKEKKSNETIQIISSKKELFESVGSKKQSDWEIGIDKIFNIKGELELTFDNCVKYEEIGNSYFGIQAYDRKSSISNFKVNNDYLPMIDGSEINRYEFSKPNKYFNFISSNIKSGGDLSVYKRTRIVVRQIGQTPIIGICEANILSSNTLYNLYMKNEDFSLKYVLAILNSKLIMRYWLSNYSDSKQLFPKIKGYQLKQLPIKVLSKECQIPFIEKVDQMLSNNENLQSLNNKFQRSIQRKFNITELPKKLQDWYLLSYSDLIKELAKKKVKLSLSEEAEWEDYFNTEKLKALEIKAMLETTDKTIDEMVYRLYGLNEQEIEMVEQV